MYTHTKDVGRFQGFTLIRGQGVKPLDELFRVKQPTEGKGRVKEGEGVNKGS